MGTTRTHHVTTTDGVVIGGTVVGQGPPLMFLQGIVGDGDLDWGRVAAHLADRFTCHLPSMRGRGLSGDHPDLSIGRLVDDFDEYIDSLGEPVGLVGVSAGANWALAVAAQSHAVAAVAPVEPVANSQMDEQEQAALFGAVARGRELADTGDFVGAMRVFAGYPLTDADIAIADQLGYFEAAARYVPNLVRAFQFLGQHEGPLPEDPAVLRVISAPVMVVHGSASKPFFAASAQHVVDHVPDARLQVIPGAGHIIPLTHPEALAEALAEFFAPAEQPA